MTESAVSDVQSVCTQPAGEIRLGSDSPQTVTTVTERYANHNVGPLLRLSFDHHGGLRPRSGACLFLSDVQLAELVAPRDKLQLEGLENTSRHRMFSISGIRQHV